MTLSPIQNITQTVAPVAKITAGNLLFKIQELVNRCSSLFSSISHRSRLSEEKLKAAYEQSTLRAASWQRKQGWCPFLCTGASVAFPLLFPRLITTESQEKIFSLLSLQSDEKTSSLDRLSGLVQNVLTGVLQPPLQQTAFAQSTIYQNDATLKSTLLGNEAQEKGGANNFLQEMMNFFNSVRELFKRVVGS